MLWLFSYMSVARSEQKVENECNKYYDHNYQKIHPPFSHTHSSSNFSWPIFHDLRCTNQCFRLFSTFSQQLASLCSQLKIFHQNIFGFFDLIPQLPYLWSMTGIIVPICYKFAHLYLKWLISFCGIPRLKWHVHLFQVHWRCVTGEIKSWVWGWLSSKNGLLYCYEEGFKKLSAFKQVYFLCDDNSRSDGVIISIDQG